MRTAPRVLLALGLTGGAVLGPAVPALAATSGTTTVGPAAEAWYRVTPACALPTGCADLSAAPSQYAPDTLHVGVNAGAEEARTYLQLDLAALPASTKPTGGTLLLPVAAAGEEGTRAPETAKIQACAVKEAVEDADGSFATALLPAKETAPPDSWHVAFSDRTRKGEGVVPISAALAFVSSALDTTSAARPVVQAPAFDSAPAELPRSFDSGATTSFAAPAAVAAPLLPAPAAQAAPAPVAAAQPVQQVVPVAQSFVQGGFRYPAVFLLPLLLAVGAGWLGRALTRDLSAG